MWLPLPLLPVLLRVLPLIILPLLLLLQVLLPLQSLLVLLSILQRWWLWRIFFLILSTTLCFYPYFLQGICSRLYPLSKTDYFILHSFYFIDDNAFDGGHLISEISQKLYLFDCYHYIIVDCDFWDGIRLTFVNCFFFLFFIAGLDLYIADLHCLLAFRFIL